MTVRAKVTASGSVSLPAEFRKRYGLSEGGEVWIDDTEGGIVITTLPQVIERAQAWSRKLLEGRTGATVDDFLAERRAEADRE